VDGHAEVWVDFEELNAKGWAQVIEEAPCPSLAAGTGHVITATITHANDDVRTLTLDSGETLHVTGNHRMFSATAGDWTAVKDLEIDEELQTSRGRQSVAALGYQHGRHQVYNIEVETEHCYFVGEEEALTHNMCGPDGGSLALEGTKNNLNSNDSKSNFGIYEIEVKGELHKVGKADMDRTTQSSGLPTRLHQQVRELEETHGKGNVTHNVTDLGRTTTAAAKEAETKRIESHVEKNKGAIPVGNQKSFKPRKK